MHDNTRVETRYQVVKRACDIAAVVVLSTPAIVIGSLIAAAVASALGRPVLFRQRRTGQGARVFTIYKFRTMSEAADSAGNPLPDSQRLGKLGELLRSWNLDELPQLWNVLVGDMTLVGPRPLLPDYLPLYSPEQSRRHHVKPGMTGWAQVNGRNLLTWEQRFALDIWYVDNRSFLLDVKILMLTVLKAVFREGVCPEGDVTMPRFTGSHGDGHA